jgi:ATP-binding cassette, subfamily B, beta-glucan exporter
MSLTALYLRVLAELGARKPLAIRLALANVLVAASAFAVPVLFGWIVDGLTAAQPVTGEARAAASKGQAIFTYAAFWAMVSLFNIAATVWVAFRADQLAHERRLGVMSDYFEHMLALPQAFHTERHSGSLLKIMFDGCNSMSDLWLSFFRENFTSILVLFVMLPFSLLINWRLGLILILLVFLFSALAMWVRRRTEGMQKSVERFHTGIAETTGDALGNVPVIQSFTRIGEEANHMRAVSRNLLQAQQPVLFWWAIVAVATQASSTLTILGILLVGILLFQQGATTVGEIVTFISFATMLIGRLEQVVGFFNRLFLNAPKLRQFFDVMDTVPSVRDDANAKATGRLSGAVRFEAVSYSYDGQRPAVSDLSFDVAAGETIALVGETGSGKSTTIGLLYRAFDPQLGRVLIDGTDIRAMTLDSLRNNIGVVFQEPMLFARSIAENVRIGDPQASDEAVTAAIALAQASDVVLRQAKGLQTVIGERGRALSGGERQRLSIARALLKDPPIMILDEATAALDAGTERKLQAALDSMRKGRTTFIIAHRLATVRNADRIMVFHDGRIVETGRFDALVAEGGRFAALAKAQYLAE